MKHLLLTSILLVGLVGFGLLGRAAQTADAQSAVWTAQFYNNPYLIGDAVTTQQYNSIYFNWGGGSPAPGVNPENFSARFATEVYFQPGTYRFYIQADDAVHLSVAFPFSPQIDTFTQPAVGQLLTTDVTFQSAGSQHVQVDYQQITGDSYLYLTWANAAANPSAPSFPAPVAMVNPWTAQYFANPLLSGAPTITQAESSPSHNWGDTAPASGVPNDNFSVRWQSVQPLNAGSYQVIVSADDGVRVFVDSTLVVNEFHGASGQTYTGTFSVQTGQHAIVIEYYEATGAAYLNFSISSMGGSTSPPSPAAGPTATVTVYRLNVRNAPGTSGAILTRINKGETYSIVGRNEDNTWWQLDVNGTIGWVSGKYIAVNNEQSVPVTSTTTPTATPGPVTGYTVTARANVNIRSGPARTYGKLGLLPYHKVAQVIGRTAGNQWWQVSYSGIIGWVSGSYVDFQTGVDPNVIPITG
jgi:uncharacterized protein YraI